MRTIVLAAAALLASATTALAAPASVSVTIAPELQKTFAKKYGVREAEYLTADLQTVVERRLTRAGALDGARVELILTDVKPNRPTFKQLGDTPGLSMQSFGIGGAAIKGQVVAADGSVTPVSYRWYESDIREAYGDWVWSDSQRAFQMFARRLAKGEELAAR